MLRCKAPRPIIPIIEFILGHVAMLDPVVAQVIEAGNFDNFTTSDVRSAFLALKKDPKLDPSNVRRMIYSELLKLQSIGESEAYKDIYLDMPELVDEIQPKYHMARDNNTKLLGKIKAIEDIIRQRT